ncbi:CocE/NonD family hydrolase [Streptomyces jumonjinensis]|uniref:CocE/NonD family hydrolase n=1 Tax=Streptomyces jumonjinensis TaxID=1945 RepID=UPI0033299724
MNATTARIPVRGARLAADITLPDGDPPFPALVIRTPYDRRRHRAEARAWAARGFAAVVQDVRGRHASDGEWHPYRTEAADGAQTLHWIREQRWCDGRVVAAGASYAAYCALVTAVGDGSCDAFGTGPAPGGGPDAVIAAVPALGPAEVAREPSGVERLLARAGWWAAHGDRPGSDPAALDKALADDPRLLEHLPVTRLPDRLGRALPSWPRIWDEHHRDQLTLRARSARIPLLAIGGARDPFAADTLRLWRDWGGPARLLLGPWGHGLTSSPAPEARPGHRLDLGDTAARWARAALSARPGTDPRGTDRRGTDHPAADRRGAVALGGSEHWYPVDGPRTIRSWHFGHPAGLRLLSGGEFHADPDRPVRSDRLDADPYPYPVPDRAVLLTPPLPRPLDLLGPAETRLRAAADTPAADWFVRLIALDPEGRAEPLALGAERRADPPGRPADFTVPLGCLARRLPAGTRLRLEIAGHHFPAHARNPHTGQNPVTATRLDPSHRSVRTAGSALLLSTGHGRRVDPVQEIRR